MRPLIRSSLVTCDLQSFGQVWPNDRYVVRKSCHGLSHFLISFWSLFLLASAMFIPPTLKNSPNR